MAITGYKHDICDSCKTEIGFNEEKTRVTLCSECMDSPHSVYAIWDTYECCYIGVITAPDTETAKRAIDGNSDIFSFENGYELTHMTLYRSENYDTKRTA